VEREKRLSADFATRWRHCTSKKIKTVTNGLVLRDLGQWKNNVCCRLPTKHCCRCNNNFFLQ